VDTHSHERRVRGSQPATTPTSKMGIVRFTISAFTSTRQIAEGPVDKSGLDFCGADLSRRVVFDVREEEHQACLCQVKPLLTAFGKRKLKLVWRVYGWKWIGGMHDNHSLQREYWALYSLDPLGRPICLGGGTWIVKPNATPEPLPWRLSRVKPSKGKTGTAP